MFLRLLIAGVLLAHGAIHIGFLSKGPPPGAGGPPWPIDLGRSWLRTHLGVSEAAVRLLAMALVAATIGGYALAALATMGILPADAWWATVAVGSLASLALLLVVVHRWLFIGVAIDVVLLWVALVVAWTPDNLA